MWKTLPEKAPWITGKGLPLDETHCISYKLFSVTRCFLQCLCRSNKVTKTGKCFNPYCDLPGSNCEIWVVSKLFSAATCHWLASQYPIWFFYSPWLKNSTIFLIGVTVVVRFDSAVFWRSNLHNFQLSTFKFLTLVILLDLHLNISTSQVHFLVNPVIERTCVKYHAIKPRHTY